MKTITIIFTLSVIIIVPTHGQWDNISINTPHSFSSVSFINEQTGFVIGGRELYKTIDGGENWDLSFLADTFDQLEEILMLNDALIVAIGYDFKNHETIIIRSTDAGASWIKIDNELNSVLRSIYFFDDLTGFAAGHYNKIFRTTDSGLNWEEMTSTIESGTFFESIFFTNAMNGYVVGGIPGRSNYGRTTDGGFNWEEILIDSDSYLQSVFFVDSLRGYIVGWSGEILVTEDSGENWSHQTSVNMAGNLEILFTNDSTGFIVGGMSNETSIQKTTDKGLNWYETGPDLDKGLIALDFPTENTGYAVGSTGTILKTINGGVTSAVDVNNETSYLSVFPNPATEMINIVSDNYIKEVHLMDAAGIEISGNTVMAFDYDLNISGYPSGIYFLVIRAGKMSGVRKVIKL